MSTIESTLYSAPAGVTITTPLSSQASNSAAGLGQPLSSEGTNNVFLPLNEQSHRTLNSMGDTAPAVETTLPSYDTPALDYRTGLIDLEQEWEDADFMDGFWQLPQMVRLVPIA